MQEEIIQGYRLSPQQEHLWSLQQSNRPYSYCAACAILIEGELLRESIKAAIEDVIDRNEILRTTFRSMSALTLPLQVISDKETVLRDKYTLIEYDPGIREAEIDKLFAEACRRQFDLESGPVMDVSLIKLSAGKHLMIISLPALCADLVGLDNLLRNIALSYAARLGGEELKENSIQYADVSEWHNEVLESEETGAGRQVWKDGDYSSLLTQKLPFENDASGRVDFDPAVLISTVRPELYAKCRALAEKYATTTACLLQTCWHALLWILSGQSPVIVGAGYDGRKHDEFKDEIGPLARYLPIHVQLEDGMPFSLILKQVDEASRAAYRWQEYFSWEQFPFDDGGGANGNFAPFAFDFFEGGKVSEAAGLRFSMVRQYACNDRFKVKLCCVQRKEGLDIEWRFDRNLYQDEVIERMEAEFEQLLESAVIDAENHISSLDVASEQDRRQILEGWNSTEVHYEGEKCLHKLFEAQVKRTPDAVALVASSQMLTYRELDARSNQLARYLIARGVGPEAPVGICMERKLEMVVALLGILKAGGGYAPLDPSYPQERLRQMLEDAGVGVLVTEEEVRGSVEGEECLVVSIDKEWGEISEQSRERVESGVRGENLAYVIYTSGSTGRPKGVMIEHRSICNRLLWMQDELPLNGFDRLLQKTAISFDASVWELFIPLMSGANLVLAEPGGQQDAAYMVEAINEHRITILQVVPTMLGVLLAEAELSSCKSLRRVYCGGEQLVSGLQDRFYNQLEAELHNLYGPTEISIDATHWTCLRHGGQKTVPIGRPIGNIQVFVLGRNMRLNPPGVNGELYVGGVGVARGYLNRPDVTAERFLPNPFDKAGARLYRTGDLTRQSSNGVVDYLGRIDRQVKVRGYRIELGEIEAALFKHQAIREAAVVVRENGAGNSDIVAYIALNKGGALSTTPDQLRAYVRERLPDYMAPAAFMILDALPLTPNGKLDRSALPSLETAQSKLAEGDVLPRTNVEKALAAIWSEVLGLKEMGIRSNFFDIGGHSLLATQMVSRIKDAFSIDLKLKTLFDGPTIEELGKHIEGKMAVGKRPQAPPIKPAPRNGGAPLSFAQQRLWFLDQLEPGSPLYNVPTVAKLTGELNVNALTAALDEIIRRHESLRTVFASVDGDPLQIIRPAARSKLKIIDLTDLNVEERERYALTTARREARIGFDLERGPLVRSTLVRLSQYEHLALLTMHHIVSDGWSVAVMVRELVGLYEAYAAGRQSPFEDLQAQYADYAVWQREWLQGEALHNQVEYWSKRLEGMPESLELPTDRPKPSARSYAGSQERFQISKATTDGLKELSRRKEVTLFMTLLAAFQTLLYRHCNQSDIIVGTDIANRHWTTVEGLIGFFGNQLVMRTDLGGNPTFSELLGRVREVTLGAYAHQDMPFDKLVEILNPKRRTGRTPLFQMKMVLQNAPTEALVLPRLTIEILEDENRLGLSRFDILLTFVEGEQGMGGILEYSTDLFDRPIIIRLLRNLERLLESIVAQPDYRLDSLEIFTEAEARERTMQKKKRHESSFEKFRSITPKTLNLSSQEFIKISHMRSEAGLPLMIEPVIEDVNLAEWLRSNLGMVEKELLNHGAILFRGFNLTSQEHFEEFLTSTACPLMNYMEGATPRTRLSDKVYTSTEYPADQYIALHNELTYVTKWPMKIYFFCLQPAAEGGETPIADVRGVYNRIDPRIRDRFVEKGWMLARNFGQALSLPWQTSFRTSDRSEAEAYFRSARIDWEWKSDGGLRTRQTRPAVAKHPLTMQMVWFNHIAFWHVSSLEPKVRNSMLAMFREDDLPYNTYYGDGSPIEDSVVDEIREAYRQERREYAWQAGDILMLDNMLVAHGRNSYSGSRRVLVAMGGASNS